MITSLRGKVVSYNNGELHLDVNGVGYSVFISRSCAEALPSVGSELSVITHLDVKENSMQLFGFSDEREREMFRLLISVSGIGTKMAHTILTHMSFGEITGLISGSLSKASVKIPGIGSKKLDLISMTLKDKIFRIGTVDATSGDVSPDITGSERSRIEALNALLNLGYQRADAEKIIREILKETPASNITTEELIKKALNF